MNTLEKIRMISALTLAAAALTALFVLPASERDRERAATLCAATKGALCDGLRNATVDRVSGAHAVTNLGEMIVFARRGPEVNVTASLDVAELGAMTVTASRLPDRLAKTKPEFPARIL